MCKCTPSIRTPFCGKLGCEWPKPEGVREIDVPEVPPVVVALSDQWDRELRIGEVPPIDADMLRPEPDTEPAKVRMVWDK